MIEAVERALIVTMLENDYLFIDKRLRKFKLDELYFTDQFNRIIVKGINRLIELDEPIDADVLRAKFIKARKWSLEYDERLIQILSHNVLTYNSFIERYEFLKRINNDKSKINMLEMI